MKKLTIAEQLSTDSCNLLSKMMKAKQESIDDYYDMSQIAKGVLTVTYIFDDASALTFKSTLDEVEIVDVS